MSDGPAETVAPPWFGQLTRLWWRTPRSFRIGSIILFIHLVLAVAGPFWAPYGLAQLGTGRPLSGMSWEHFFGVDRLGRDVFSRVIHGGHIVILCRFREPRWGSWSG